MKIVIKTIEEMLKDPGVLKNEVSLQKDGEVFCIGSVMEEELCGKTFEVKEAIGTKHWPYLINDFFIPSFAVKEVLKDEN